MVIYTHDKDVFLIVCISTCNTVYEIIMKIVFHNDKKTDTYKFKKNLFYFSSFQISVTR